MFLLQVEIKADLIPEEKKAELFAGHEAWIEKNYAAEKFLMMGPFTSRSMAGVVIGQVESMEELEKIVSEDAFYPDYADYTLDTFSINKVSSAISNVKEKD